MDLTPKEIVKFLDEYVIGQGDAKRVIAVALRNRYRRLKLSAQQQEEVMPKNILMIGSTGVGKTEIARRLAKLFGLPFVKVEASKYTEVGYVGRDVESMVRDLARAGLALVEKEAYEAKKSRLRVRLRTNCSTNSSRHFQTALVRSARRLTRRAARRCARSCKMARLMRRRLKSK